MVGTSTGACSTCTEPHFFLVKGTLSHCCLGTRIVFSVSRSTSSQVRTVWHIVFISVPPTRFSFTQLTVFSTLLTFLLQVLLV